MPHDTRNDLGSQGIVWAGYIPTPPIRPRIGPGCTTFASPPGIKRKNLRIKNKCFINTLISRDLRQSGNFSWRKSGPFRPLPVADLRAGRAAVGRIEKNPVIPGSGICPRMPGPPPVHRSPRRYSQHPPAIKILRRIIPRGGRGRAVICHF